MKALLRRLFRLWGPVVVASLVGASVFSPSLPAKADTGCWTANSTLPQYGTPNIATGPLCSSSGALVVSGPGGGSLPVTTVFPYNVVNGQTLQSSSALAVGGRDANGNFSPLKLDASQNLDVNVISSSAATTFPYAGTNGQTLTAASFLGAGARDANGQFSPLQEDASQNLLAKINVALPTGANTIGNVGLVAGSSAIGSITNTSFIATQATGSNLHAVIDSGAITATAALPYSGTSDAQTATTASAALNALYNGTTVDRWRSTSASNPGVAAVGICDPTTAGRCGAVDASGNQAVNVNAWGLGSTTTLGKVTALQPYGASLVQATQATSFVGVAGFDGTTVDALAVTTSGVLKTQGCNSTGATCGTAGAPADGAGVALGTYSNSQNLAWNGSFWDRVRKDSYAAGPLWMTSGGSSAAVAIAAATSGPTVIKASAGRLSRVLITTAGTTGTETFYDNASACSGTVIGIIPGTTALATAVAGAAPYLFDMFAANGITGCGGAGSPGVSVGYF
jgi:hypothetical protein